MPKKITQLTALAGTVADTDLFEVAEDAGSGNFDSRKVTFLQIKNSMTSGLTVGTTAIASGTVGRVLFQGSGNVLQQDAALFWDNTNKRLGVGATPASTVRLDVRAQGALSTDVGFRLRNSGDTVNLMEVRGDGGWIFRNNGNTGFFYYDGTNGWQQYGSSTTLTTTVGATTTIKTNGVFMGVGTSAKVFSIYDNGNYQLEESTGILQTSGQGGLSLKVGTAPSANTTDRITMYAADIVAGNASPHFRTENGDIVKVYSIGGWDTPTGTLTRTTFDSGTVTLAQLAERVAALISDLKTGHQLLKA